jgi:steroid 5-alpha reductase family enzyme
MGAAQVCGLMLVLWLIHLPLRNASIVDPGWAGGLAGLAMLYAWLGGGYGPRCCMIGAMAGVWGLRLALFLLFTRVLGHPEEGRYVELRRRWGGNIALKFLLFFQFQAATCIVLSLPFLLAAGNPSPEISSLEYAGFGLWIIALLGETFADAQLQSFKSNPANRGKTCRAGLWRYSRHPNYFFEWLIWVSFALFATASPYGYLAWLCPALMLFFLFRVTAIPATEAQALRTKGRDYQRYQQSTNVFVPWFPRAHS